MRKSYPAGTDNLRQILEDIEDFALSAGCSPERIIKLTLLSEEIITNIINYAYKDGGGTIEVGLADSETAVLLTFADSGAEFNPLLKDPPDITQGVEERQVGGLGIFLALELAENISYKRTDSRNILTAVFRKREDTGV